MSRFFRFLKSRLGRATVLGFVTGAIGIVFAFTPPGASGERATLNWLFIIRGPIQPPAEVVVVGIDKNAADQLGLPSQTSEWPRFVHARLIDSLVKRGASIIVFDLAFLEPRSSEEDTALAAAIARANRVVLLEHVVREEVRTPVFGNLSIDRIVSPIPQLSDAAIGVGPFPLPKVPARVNQFWAFKDVAGQVPTLPVVALQVHVLQVPNRFEALLKRAGSPELDIVPQDRAEMRSAENLRELMRFLRFAFKEDPEIRGRLLSALATQANEELSSRERRAWTALVNLYGGEDSYYLNFYGPPGTIQTIPYASLLPDGDPYESANEFDLTGKVVFVGVAEFSSAQQSDSFYTVFSRADGVDLSGVEIAATAFANLLTGRTLRISLFTNLSILLVLGSLVGTLAYLLPALRAVVLISAIGSIYFGAALFLFINYDLWVPVFIPLAQLPSAFVIGLLFQYFSEKSKSEKFEQELAVAQEIQRTLLPHSLPQVGKIHLCAFSEPTRFVGGDFYDFFLLNSNEFLGVLGDVSGKGVSAALLASSVQAALDREYRSGAPLGEVLVRVNDFLYKRSPSNRFVTLFLFSLNAQGQGEFVSAGHNPAYLFRGSTGEIEELTSDGLLLGAFDSVSYQPHFVQLNPTDVLVVYSDGVTDAENPQGEMFGEVRLQQIIKSNSLAGAEVLKKRILDSIEQFTKGKSQTDDITFVIVERDMD